MEQELTPKQRELCRLIRQGMAEFYRCPENERKCLEWMESMGIASASCSGPSA